MDISRPNTSKHHQNIRKRHTREHFVVGSNGEKHEAPPIVAPAETDFGQTDFGHPYLTDFGQSDCGQFYCFSVFLFFKKRQNNEKT